MFKKGDICVTHTEDQWNNILVIVVGKESTDIKCINIHPCEAKKEIDWLPYTERELEVIVHANDLND